MSDLQARMKPNERITLRPIVGLSANGEGLEFWCEDVHGTEYEIHGQVSFTFDKSWQGKSLDPPDQVAVVAFCDPRLNPFK